MEESGNEGEKCHCSTITDCPTGQRTGLGVTEKKVTQVSSHPLGSLKLKRCGNGLVKELRRYILIDLVLF